MDLINLRKVFDGFRYANLKLKFFLQAVRLGYTVLRTGISAEPRKVENFSTSHDVTLLRSFLGLASY